MHDVAWHHEVNCVRSKDAQRQLARTSLSPSISMYVLLIALHILLMVLVGRICLHIKTPHLY